MLQVKESWEEAAVAGVGGQDLHMHGVIAAPRVRKAENLWWLATEGNLSHQQTCLQNTSSVLVSKSSSGGQGMRSG